MQHSKITGFLASSRTFTAALLSLVYAQPEAHLHVLATGKKQQTIDCSPAYGKNRGPILSPYGH